MSHVSSHLCCRSAISALVVLAACQAPSSNGTPVSPMRGLAFTAIEGAHDGRFGLTPNADTPDVIDIHSKLRISFEVDAATGAPRDEPRAEWVSLQAMLEAVLAFQSEAADLNAVAVEPADSAGIESHRRELEAYLKRLGDFEESVLLYLTETAPKWIPATTPANDRPTAQNFPAKVVTDKFDKIKAGELTGRSDPARSYSNLAAWLRVQVDEVSAEGNKAVREAEARAEQVKVTVQAFHTPVGGEQGALHVQNYDMLPVGELQPVDRHGLKLTPAGERRVSMELEQADRAAGMIREIKSKGPKLKDDLLALIEAEKKKLQAGLQRLVEGLEAGTEDWDSGLDELAATLQPMAVDSNASLAKAASDLRDNITEIKKQLEGVRLTHSDIKRLVDTLRGKGQEEGSGAALAALLSDSSGLLKTAQKVVDTLDSLGKVVKLLPEIETQLGTVVRESGKRRAQLLSEKARAFLDQQVGEFQATMLAVQGFQELVKRGRKEIPLQDQFNELPSHLITRTLNDLPEAVVDLRRAGVTIGDQIDLVVATYDTAGGNTKGTPTRYETQVEKTGFHSEVHGTLIFARAQDGTSDAESWKPNVAAVADWHYRVRQPDDFWQRTWNFLDPGFGVHLASLDQGDDSVEFGMGLNVAFLNGFLIGGYGWNLSASNDPEYYFVGLDLMNALSLAKQGR